MKKSHFLILFVCVGLMAGCAKSTLDANFNVKDSENFTIPPNSLLSLPPILTPPFATSSWQGDFSNNNTDKAHLKSLKLKSLLLTITNPPGKTFGFIKSIDIYIQAPNLADTKIAFIDNNPSNAGSTINMNVVDVDIAAYAKSDHFTLKVVSTPQATNTDNVDVKADMSFNVIASVL
jgi:hypothetical protein